MSFVVARVWSIGIPAPAPAITPATATAPGSGISSILVYSECNI